MLRRLHAEEVAGVRSQITRSKLRLHEQQVALCCGATHKSVLLRECEQLEGVTHATRERTPKMSAPALRAALPSKSPPSSGARLSRKRRL